VKDAQESKIKKVEKIRDILALERTKGKKLGSMEKAELAKKLTRRSTCKSRKEGTLLRSGGKGTE